MEELLKKAEAGDAASQYELGLYYINKEDGEITGNQTQAFNWFKKAAEQGLKEAQCNTGCCYEEGIGTDKDLKLAFAWYSKAAEQDDPIAQYSLGCCYLNGDGCKVDEDKAFMYWKKSAKTGYAPSQKNLGICFIEGIGTKKNEEKGIEWLKKAAEQEDEEAIEILKDLEEN